MFSPFTTHISKISSLRSISQLCLLPFGGTWVPYTTVDQHIWADADTWFERQQEEEMQRFQAENRAAMQAAEELHRRKVAQEREGEREEDAEDPMARAEAEV